MKGLKEILKSLPILKQVDYDCDKSIVVTIDTSLIAIGWAISQSDVEGKWFAIRFGARIFIEHQRAYPQVKRELLDALIALKADRNYLMVSMLSWRQIICHYLVWWLIVLFQTLPCCGG